MIVANMTAGDAEGLQKSVRNIAVQVERLNIVFETDKIPSWAAAINNLKVIVAQDFKGAEAEVYHADAPAYYLPQKKDVYTKMEALIWHFKIIMGETDIPPGEVYHSVEGANGELGFYLISDGGRTPYRLHFRMPCFIYYQAYSELTKGSMLSDAVIVMSSLNLIAGEMDA